jgi:Recombinase zinc beta ribbon domain
MHLPLSAKTGRGVPQPTGAAVPKNPHAASRTATNGWTEPNATRRPAIAAMTKATGAETRLLTIAQHERNHPMAPKLHARGPKVVAPRVTTGPVLLTGLAVCASCHGAMTSRTGTSKTGAVHRYYTCSTCMRKGKTACKGRSIPMVRLDTLVSTHLAERWLEELNSFFVAFTRAKQRAFLHAVSPARTASHVDWEPISASRGSADCDVELSTQGHELGARPALPVGLYSLRLPSQAVSALRVTIPSRESK